MPTLTDFILQTKISIPRLKGKILPRPRVVELLRRNRDKRLITICTDAGYGKTTAIIQFCNALDEPFIYYSVGPSDSDLAIFLNYVIAGMQKHYPAFGEHLRQILPQTRDIEILVGTFINEFVEKCKDEFYMVLDDFHHVQNSREIVNALDYLLKNSPAHLHLVIASRMTPALDFAYYLAKQELFQIGEEVLKFPLDEIQALLEETYALHVSEEELLGIERHSEGWITVIQLILQKIKSAGAERARDTLNGYIASGEEVFNYFAREVFEHQSGKVREFLMRTSILEVLDPETCNCLLDINDSRRMLADLEAAHLFVSKVGSDYRYHPLFHEYLSEKLKEYYPTTKIKELHDKIGDFLLKRQNPKAAIVHLLLAENYAPAAHLLVTDFEHWASTGEYQNYIALVDRFPRTVVEAYPQLLMKKAGALMRLGQTETSRRVLHQVVSLARKMKKNQVLANAYAELAHSYQVSFESDKVKRYLNLANRLADKKDARLRVYLQLCYGFFYQRQGKYAKTEACLTEARKTAERVKDPRLELSVLRSLASFYWAKFNYKKALEIYESIVSRHDTEQINIDIGIIYVSAAMMALPLFDFKKTTEYLDRAESFAEKFHILHVKAMRQYIQADLLSMKREYGPALESYEKVIELGRQLQDKLLEFSCINSICWIYIKMGKLTSCVETLKPYESWIKKTTHPTVLVKYHQLQSRINVLQHRCEAALEHLKIAIAKSQLHKQPYLEMESYFEMTHVYLVQNAGVQASSAFRKALQIAQANEYETAVIGLAYDDLSLIEFALKHDIETDYLTNIIRRTDTEEARRLAVKLRSDRGMCDIECLLLGRLAIRDKKGEVFEPRWRSQKGKSLFAHVIVNRATGCTKDALIDSLWPGKDLKEAAHVLQVEMSWLRSLIKKVTETELPAKTLIDFRNQKYDLDPNLVVRTDIEEFEQLIKEGDAQGRNDGASSIRLYERALALYRGDFVSDIDDEWADRMRLHYRELLLKLLKRLGQLHFADRDYQRSLKLYQQALSIDQFDEAIHAQLMLCYKGMGDRKGVQQQYEILVKKLSEAGAGDPSAKVQKLYQESLE